MNLINNLIPEIKLVQLNSTQSKLKVNQLKGSLVMIGHTINQTDKQRLLLYILYIAI